MRKSKFSRTLIKRRARGLTKFVSCNEVLLHISRFFFIYFAITGGKENCSRTLLYGSSYQGSTAPIQNINNILQVKTVIISHKLIEYNTWYKHILKINYKQSLSTLISGLASLWIS